MNTFEKKLANKANEAINKGEALVDDVKLLLASDAQEERKVLSAIGLDNDLQYVESKQADIITRKRANKELERSIVHINEIEKLCKQYRLRMRRAKNYTGVIPRDLGAELTRFCKEKNVVLAGTSERSNFYIIAPPKMFVGYKSPIRVLADAIDFSIKEAAERKRIRDQDPILVYQLPEDKNYFAVIKSWGNDFAPIRRLYGFLSLPRVVKTINFVGNLIILFALYKLAVWQWEYIAPNCHPSVEFPHKNAGCWWGALQVSNCIILFVGANLWLWLDYTKDIRKYLVENINRKKVINLD